MSGYWDAELDQKPRHELEAWQVTQLPRFLERLSAQSSFYRSHFSNIRPEDVTSLEALAELPLLSKDALRALQADASPETPYGAHQCASTNTLTETLASSGTTGRPTYYALTQRDHAAWTDVIANAFFTSGMRPEHKVVHTTTLTMAAGGIPYADGIRRIGCNLIWVGGYQPARMLATMLQLRTDAMILTPSFATYLTDHCEEMSMISPRDAGLRLMIGGGEPGMSEPTIRDRLYREWQLEAVRETMGLTDVVASLWSECTHGPGMHFIASRIAIVELIDPETTAVLPWKDGEEGEPVYTTFDREATPVVRFRSRDRVRVVATECACGRTSPKVLCVGRTDDMLIYKAMNVFPSAIRDVALAAAGDFVTPVFRVLKQSVDQVQFLDPIPVEIEGKPGLSAGQRADAERRIELAVRSALQVRIAPRICEAGTIPVSPYKNSLVHVNSH